MSPSQAKPLTCPADFDIGFPSRFLFVSTLHAPCFSPEVPRPGTPRTVPTNFVPSSQGSQAAKEKGKETQCSQGFSRQQSKAEEGQLGGVVQGKRLHQDRKKEPWNDNSKTLFFMRCVIEGPRSQVRIRGTRGVGSGYLSH